MNKNETYADKWEKHNPKVDVKALLKEFFRILDIEEESMNQTVFHPNYFASCRVVDWEKMNKVMKELREVIL